MHVNGCIPNITAKPLQPDERWFHSAAQSKFMPAPSDFKMFHIMQFEYFELFLQPPAKKMFQFLHFKMKHGTISVGGVKVTCAKVHFFLHQSGI